MFRAGWSEEGSQARGPSSADGGGAAPFQRLGPTHTRPGRQSPCLPELTCPNARAQRKKLRPAAQVNRLKYTRCGLQAAKTGSLGLDSQGGDCPSPAISSHLGLVCASRLGSPRTKTRDLGFLCPQHLPHVLAGCWHSLGLFRPLGPPPGGTYRHPTICCFLPLPWEGNSPSSPVSPTRSDQGPQPGRARAGVGCCTGTGAPRVHSATPPQQHGGARGCTQKSHRTMGKRQQRARPTQSLF